MYLELEEKLLGTYSENNSLFDGIEHLVGPYLFSGVHKNAYNFIKANHEKNVITEGFLLHNHLRSIGVPEKGLKDKCIKLTTSDPITKMDPKPKVQTLFDNYVRKVLAPMFHEGAVDFMSENGDTWGIIEKVRNKITDIDATVNNVQKTVSITDIYEESLKEIIELREGKKQAGFPTGLTEHDSKSGGVTSGVTVIGAPPGAGKSSLVVSIIKKNAVDSDVPVIFFSIEMPAKQVMINLLANMYSINSFALRTGQIDDNELAVVRQAKNKFKSNLIIDDAPGINWKYVDSQFRKIRKKVPLSTPIMAIIDYLQIMGLADGEYMMSQEQQMATRCRELLNSAKRWNVHLIELSQLSRDVAKRIPPRPMLSDLKESGAIEANAGQVWLLYRPDYYDKNPVDEQGNDLRGLCEINRAKNRYGSTGATYVKFAKQYSQFLDRGDDKPEF